MLRVARLPRFLESGRNSETLDREYLLRLLFVQMSLASSNYFAILG